MKIEFMHPRHSLTFPADVDEDTTGRTCIDNLVGEGFIPPPASGQPYAIVVQRTNRQLLPQTTMQEAQVVNGDSLCILQQEQGASAEGAR